LRRPASWLPAALLLLLSCSPGAPSGEVPTNPASPLSPPPAEGLPEATSLLGEALHAPELEPGVYAERERAWVRARERFAAAPEDLDALIWAGRRAAYLGHYREAVRIYSRGLDIHGEEPRLLRHRGHRHITLRNFDLAVADLSRAAELIRGQPDRVEEDGLPNARGIPVGSLHSNIWYHLGLAQYLRGDFEAALTAWEAGAEVAGNPDLLVSNGYWHCLTLRRLGRDEEARAVLAPIVPGLDVIENGTYYRLTLMFKGALSKGALSEGLGGTPEALLAEAGKAGGLDFATTAYGVGAWYLTEGRQRDAEAVFRQILAGSDQWAAFGYIAAESELARLAASPLASSPLAPSRPASSR